MTSHPCPVIPTGLCVLLAGPELTCGGAAGGIPKYGLIAWDGASGNVCDQHSGPCVCHILWADPVQGLLNIKLSHQL